MKHINRALLLSVLCTQNMLFSAEIELQDLSQTQTSTPEKNTTNQATHNNLTNDQIVTSIDTAINKKNAPPGDFLINLVTPAPRAKHMLDIISIATQCYPTTILSNTILNVLYAKNKFFKQAIDHFTTIAHQNLNTVTIDNIDTIEDPKKMQPTDALNTLAWSIKSYVMQKALEQNDCTYDIVLTGHKNNIRAFDISIL